ncbi:hypothetical protein SARC_03434 [Sphaeroforma arctica JP610]|uniref:Uncharacterized protein n=1 Tax=Sphaeroforma arctica JP610 TaxID=667725 RepID=A0A0L0G5X5_9EUKA|nr:hypothetical protein SARC_03434 [Sphaeroforma arctica JP610]KNC84354.1 hypothetical protein SARC_03434 [Sphaeroforma arctica JP610]|eukprot:XP_014158256.1 hypothetical protein SARC_03434 [Sphaeroforma arctica JP610]
MSNAQMMGNYYLCTKDGKGVHVQSAAANHALMPQGNRRGLEGCVYHKLHANEGDADFETSMAALNHDGLDSDDEDEEAIKLSKPVKSCLRKPARGKGKAQADSPTPRRTEKLVHFDNEFEIAWTHKKERYERSFYPPSMREAKTRSEGIANEVQDLHKDLFGDDGSYCFAMAVRKARLAKMQKAKIEALDIAEGTSNVSGGGPSS